jgi:2-haloacid dehalogenase
VEVALVASVIAFDVNETLLDLGALDAPFEALFGSAALRPQWFALMLQLSFVGGLTGQYVDFTAAQRAGLAMLAEREAVPLSPGDIDGLACRTRSLPWRVPACGWSPSPTPSSRSPRLSWQAAASAAISRP